MALITSQKIATYYEHYKSIEVTFTKDIIQVTGMNTKEVLLKCLGDFWPCVIYSSSFSGAKVVASIKSGLNEKLAHANNVVSLRFSFKNPDDGAQVNFFVVTRSMGYVPYTGSPDMGIFTLQFTQRPPDYLIEIMGRLLDANVNSAKRRDDRITLTEDAVRKLKILSKESAVFIEGVPRRCILRDVSFSGVKLIMMGVAKFLVDRDSSIRLDFDDPRESFLIKGKFLEDENVEGRKELVAMAIEFEDVHVPMGYKVRINEYFERNRVESRVQDQKAAKAAQDQAAAQAQAAQAQAEAAQDAQTQAAPAEAKPEIVAPGGAVVPGGTAAGNGGANAPGTPG